MTSTLRTDHPEADTPVGAQGRAEPFRGGNEQDELAARLRLAVTRLHRCLRQQADGGLTPSQASALAGVRRLGSPTLGALAASESVQPPSMTRIVGALEELGYVTRVVDDADRRVARITITPSGEEVLRHNRSLKNAFLAERLLRLDADDRGALADLTALLERLVERDEP
ncbi:MAG: MarR family transcriptional regulator [Acidimicrobiales bacterium]|jgi:DNA-binding MarR family transcriptional regulator